MKNVRKSRPKDTPQICRSSSSPCSLIVLRAPKIFARTEKLDNLMYSTLQICRVKVVRRSRFKRDEMFKKKKIKREQWVYSNSRGKQSCHRMRSRGLIQSGLTGTVELRTRKHYPSNLYTFHIIKLDNAVQ